VSQKRSWGYRGGPGVTAGDVTEDQGSRGLVSQTSWCHKELVSQRGIGDHRGAGVTEEDLGSQRTWPPTPSDGGQAGASEDNAAVTEELLRQELWWPHSSRCGMVAYGGLWWPRTQLRSGTVCVLCLASTGVPLPHPVCPTTWSPLLGGPSLSLLCDLGTLVNLSDPWTWTSSPMTNTKRGQ
jgi:hypothetical protein